MSVLTDALGALLSANAPATETGGEKIALYGMIGVLGSALLTGIFLAVNTWLGRRPVANPEDTDRLDLIEDWCRLVLGIDPAAILNGHETLQELQHARPRPFS